MRLSSIVGHRQLEGDCVAQKSTSRAGRGDLRLGSTQWKEMKVDGNNSADGRARSELASQAGGGAPKSYYDLLTMSYYNLRERLPLTRVNAGHLPSTGCVSPVMDPAVVSVPRGQLTLNLEGTQLL